MFIRNNNMKSNHNNLLKIISENAEQFLEFGYKNKLQITIFFNRVYSAPVDISIYLCCSRCSKV